MADRPTKVSAKKMEQKPAERTRSAQLWSPWEEPHREIDRLLGSVSRGVWMPPVRRSIFDIEPVWRGGPEMPVARPFVDIVETDKAYELCAELPGLDEKNIEVTLTNCALTIRGEEKEKEAEDKSYHLQERRFGSFERSFGLPEDVDEDKIQARYKNGVLTVTLPRKAETFKPAKKIDVKAAA